MKKITLIILAFAFVQLNAQTDDTGNSQYEKRKPTDEEKAPKYKTWVVGIDIGQTGTLMDMYSLEAGKNSLWEPYGKLFQLGASVKLEKWFTSYLGLQGQAGYNKITGSKKEYAFTTPQYRMGLNVLLNLSGVGGRNKSKQRKHAWILSGGLGTSWGKPELYTFYDGINNPPLTEPEFLYRLTGDGTSTFVNPETSEKWTNHSFSSLGIEWRWRFAEYFDLKVGSQAVLFFGDNVDGSQTLEATEPNIRFARPSYFRNTANNDALIYTSVGVNWYFGGKKVKGDDVIIYTNPFTDLERRVGVLEDNVDNLMADGDNDGVSDYFDKEPETPEGYIVDGGGTTLDLDRDGIPDEIDEDPFSTKGAEVDANGREYDADQDGVPDGSDLEPNTPVGQLVNYQGVAIKDRIGGGSGNDSYFLPSVYFDFNKSLLTKANYQRMAVVANYMKANPGIKVDVVGNTDPVGTESYNQNLGERRAKAVIKAMVNDFDIDESRFNVVSKGESELISKRNDINRRVEFRIK